LCEYKRPGILFAWPGRRGIRSLEPNTVDSLFTSRQRTKAAHPGRDSAPRDSAKGAVGVGRPRAVRLGEILGQKPAHQLAMAVFWGPPLGRVCAIAFLVSGFAARNDDALFAIPFLSEKTGGAWHRDGQLRRCWSASRGRWARRAGRVRISRACTTTEKTLGGRTTVKAWEEFGAKMNRPGRLCIVNNRARRDRR